MTKFVSVRGALASCALLVIAATALGCKEKRASPQQATQASESAAKPVERTTRYEVVLYCDKDGNNTPLYVEDKDGKMVWADEAIPGDAIYAYESAEDSERLEEKNAVRRLSNGKEEAMDFVHVRYYDKDYWTRPIFITGKRHLRGAAVTADKRKEQIEATISSLSEEATELKDQVEGQKQGVESSFKALSDLLDKEDELNGDTDFLNRKNLNRIEDLREDIEQATQSLYQSTLHFIHLVSRLAEVNRQKKALEAEKDDIKTGDDFKDNATGASMAIVAENISVATADGEGNLHTNAGAGISVRTPHFNMRMMDDKGKLVEGGNFSVNAENITLASVNPSDDMKEQPVTGSVSIHSKTISLEAVDYQSDDKSIKEKELTADGKITMTAKTVEVATTNPKDIERDDQGKLTKGEYTAEGDVIIRSKTVSVESLDYEVADGELKTKALSKDGKIAIRAEKTDVLAADAEGKATGSINLNAKAVSVKSMDVDKEKLTDDKLAEGSTMTLVSEKMYVGAKSKDVKSKKLQAVSEEMGLFADKTFEAQQGEAKAVVQLDGGKLAIGSDKNEICGDTEVKGEVKAPKAAIDNLEAKSSFKSSNISDGMAAGGGGGGSVSAKLKTEDAPKD